MKKDNSVIFSLEVESEVEVFEMKQEIVSLQAKLEDGGGDIRLKKSFLSEQSMNLFLIYPL